MSTVSEKKIIEGLAAEFFLKMGTEATDIQIEEGLPEASDTLFSVQVSVESPQMLIGQNGSTLFELQRILRILLNKKVGRNFYLNLDINGYKQKKLAYLVQLAEAIANEVSASGEPKALAPMSSYERRILHQEFSKRADITTESQGDGDLRHIIVSSKQAV
jgi:spoIIIJ-associated protein